MHPKVDTFLNNLDKWQKELKKLRSILLDTPLTEDFKWHQPCYTYNNANIAIITGLKEYCAIGFFKGTLLKDTKNILEKPGENTQSARLVKFTSVKQITDLAPTLKAYITEAIEIETAGLKVDFKKATEYTIPEEFKKALHSNPALKKAFYALTPGRQKGYLLYFSAPKQSKTRTARIEKYTQQILNGKGFHD